MTRGPARARWTSWVTAIWVAGPNLLPGTVAAAPTTTSATSIQAHRDPESTLVVEVDPATLDAEALRARVLDEGTKSLAKRAEPLGSEDEIRVRLEGQTFDYRIIVELRRRGIPLTEQPEVSTCQCSSSELLQAVTTAIDEGASRLQEVRRSETQVPASTAAAPGASEPTAPAKPRVQRSDRLWVTGVVLTSFGAATSVAGTTMALVGPQRVEPIGYVDRDWRAPGYVLISAGAAMLVGGVTMIVVDELRCRRRGRCRAKGERRS